LSPLAADELFSPASAGFSSYRDRRSVSLITMSTRRRPHREHTRRSCQSGTVVSAPYRSAISAGSGST
jgi:hypothetical protein